MPLKRKKTAIQFDSQEEQQQFIDWVKTGDPNKSGNSKALKAIKVARKNTKKEPLNG